MTTTIHVSMRDLVADAIRARLYTLRQTEQVYVDLQRALDRGESVDLDQVLTIERSPLPALQPATPPTPPDAARGSKKTEPKKGKREKKAEPEPGPRRYKHITLNKKANRWRGQKNPGFAGSLRLTQLEAATDVATNLGCKVEDLLLPDSKKKKGKLTLAQGSPKALAQQYAQDQAEKIGPEPEIKDLERTGIND